MVDKDLVQVIWESFRTRIWVHVSGTVWNRSCADIKVEINNTVRSQVRNVIINQVSADERGLQ